MVIGTPCEQGAYISRGTRVARAVLVLMWDRVGCRATHARIMRGGHASFWMSSKVFVRYRPVAVL